MYNQGREKLFDFMQSFEISGGDPESALSYRMTNSDILKMKNLERNQDLHLNGIRENLAASVSLAGELAEKYHSLVSPHFPDQDMPRFVKASEV
jgi:hypothetical protein